MSAEISPYRADLERLIREALATNQPAALEKFLMRHGGLPAPQFNRALVTEFAALIARLVVEPEPPVERLESLLDGWASLALSEPGLDGPGEILPVAAVSAYGQVALARPEWQADEAVKLRWATLSPHPLTRETAIAALQAMGI